MVEYNKENAQRLAKKIVESVERTGLEDIVMDALMREYEADEDYFLRDWEKMQMEDSEYGEFGVY
jgi:hypothetical protein